MPTLDRRAFLGLAAGSAAALGLASCSSGSSKPAPLGATPPKLGSGKDAPFDHVVLCMMENRSFDHMIGWLPGADGRQAGLEFPDTTGALHPSHDLGTEFQNCAAGDPDHSWQGGLKQVNGGRMDGFLLTAEPGDTFPIGYYSRGLLPITETLATRYTTFDRYFCALLAPTWPNRLYTHAATTDLDVTGLFVNGQATPQSHITTTIWDRVLDAGLSAGYYFKDEPMTGVFATRKYDVLNRTQQQFFDDARTGKLPNVSFLEPDYGGVQEYRGLSNDDHPWGNMLVGEGFLRDVHDAIARSPQWDRTVLVFTWDEWGGFFDHVPPPRVVDDTVNPAPGPHPDYAQLGVRVPCFVVSPYAPARLVRWGPYEHCSVLSMIEWRWGLPPLTARDAHARNLAETLDFSRRRSPAALPAFTPPTPQECAVHGSLLG